MEENKKVKVRFGTVICIIVIILLVIGLGVMYYFGFVKNKENNNNTNTDIATTGNTTDPNAKKIDESKDYVYDAKYYENEGNKSYETPSGEKIELKDINMPYININSEDAKKANNEIKEIYDKMAKLFKEEYEDTKTWYNIASYETYTNDNILSVVIETEAAGTDVPVYNYYTYNFDLDTLKFVSYEDICKKTGFDTDNSERYIEIEISYEVQDKMKGFDASEINEYIKKSVDSYKEAVNNKTIGYFISEVGFLNIITTIHIPVGSGEFSTILEIIPADGDWMETEYTSADSQSAQGNPSILTIYRTIYLNELGFEFNHGFDPSKQTIDRKVSGTAKLTSENTYEYIETIDGKEYKLTFDYSVNAEEITLKEYLDGKLNTSINLFSRLMQIN